MSKKTKKLYIKIFKKNPKLRWILISIAGFIGLVFLSFTYYSYLYSDKIFPNVFIGQVAFGGLNKAEAKQILNDKIAASQNQTIILSYQDKKWELNSQEFKINYDIDKTLNELNAIGRNQSFLRSIKEQFLAIFIKQKVLAVYNFDQQKLNDSISDIAGQIDKPAKDASVVFDKEIFKVVEENEGLKLDQQQAKKEITDTVGSLANFKENKLAVILDKPNILAQDIENTLPQIKQLVDKNLFLKSEIKDYQITPSQIITWLKLTPSKVLAAESTLPTAPPPIIFVTAAINQEKVKAFVAQIAGEFVKEPKDAKLTISGGRVSIFEASEDGTQLDQEKAVIMILEALANGGKKEEVKLPVKVLKPKITLATINDLGIKELIGEGTSNFKGSTQNRIKNITIGANLFNGVLIAPGEIFSFMKILGEVSASKGFVPELVIKEDRLVPETGGGLCQVSTTMFRAALYSGLDIIERTPHAFRVRYYEPPVGFDATVYDPKPDLTFKNDTANYILIQTKIDGLNLTFQFYGTKDGRHVEVSEPALYDYTSPSESVYIDDPNLPAGEEVQIERAVSGVTASFNWKVIRDNEVINKRTFVSKYVAWPAKFKRGTGPAAPPENPPAEQPAPVQPTPAETPPAAPAPTQ